MYCHKHIILIKIKPAEIGDISFKAGKQLGHIKIFAYSRGYLLELLLNQKSEFKVHFHSGYCAQKKKKIYKNISA